MTEQSNWVQKFPDNERVELDITRFVNSIKIKHLATPRFTLEEVNANGGVIPLRIPRRIEVPFGQSVEFHSEFILDIPRGYVGVIYPRKRFGLKGAVINAPLIKANWNQDFVVSITNQNQHHVLELLENEEVAQIVVTPILDLMIELQ